MRKAWEIHWPYEKSIMKKIKGLNKKSGHEKSLGKNTGHMINLIKIKGLKKLDMRKACEKNHWTYEKSKKKYRA